MSVYRFTKETLPSSDFHPTSPATASPAPSAQTFTPQPSSASIPSPDLVKQLMKLLNGDRGAADRLVALSQSREPGKPIDYHYEKAIGDIKRDRGH
ncbi:hypothetical protein [Egbenema bharatensis]|uniref:hypothetical protein n=1 Tax=Egbenema bharatensis TaxID=3463334 RepID=UPI003A8829B2